MPVYMPRGGLSPTVRVFLSHEENTEKQFTKLHCIPTPYKVLDSDMGACTGAKLTTDRLGKGGARQSKQDCLGLDNKGL